MITIERSAEIEAAPDKIWNFISDFGNWKRLTETKLMLSKRSNDFHMAQDMSPGVGAVVVMEGKHISMDWMIREWEPNQKLSVAAEEKRRLASYNIAVAIAITPKTSLTTQGDIRFDFEPIGGLLNLAASIFPYEKNFEKKVDDILNNLKTAVLAP